MTDKHALTSVLLFGPADVQVLTRLGNHKQPTHGGSGLATKNVLVRNRKHRINYEVRREDELKPFTSILLNLVKLRKKNKHLIIKENMEENNG